MMSAPEPEPVPVEGSSNLGQEPETTTDDRSRENYCAVCRNKEGKGEVTSLSFLDFYILLKISVPLGALSQERFQGEVTPLCPICFADVWTVKKLVGEIEEIEKSVNIVRKLLKEKILTCSRKDEESDSELARVVDRIRINIQREGSEPLKPGQSLRKRKSSPSERVSSQSTPSKDDPPRKSSFGRTVRRPRQYSDEEEHDEGGDIEKKFDPGPSSICQAEIHPSGKDVDNEIKQFEAGEPVEILEVESCNAPSASVSPFKKKTPGSAQEPAECKHCKKMFKSRKKLSKHMWKVHPGDIKRSTACKGCDKQFSTPAELMEHRLKEHPPKKTKFDSKTGSRSFQCDLCSLRFRNYCDLQVHYRHHTNEKPFKCCIDSCEQTFVSKLKLEQHIESKHTSEAPLKCTECPRAFFRPHRLRHHLRTHRKEKPYMCEICSKAFSQPAYLKYHQTTHSELNLEQFKCDKCDKKFASPVNLRHHITTIHQKLYRFKCDLCEYGATHASHMRLHMRCHNGEKPYTCQECNKSYTRSSQLTIHMRTHTGERPFLCVICSKGFTNSSKLRRHEATHKNKKIKTEVMITPLPEPLTNRSTIQSQRLVAVGADGTEILLPTEMVGVQVEEDANGQPVLKLEHIPGQDQEFTVEHQQVITDGNGMAFRIIEIDDGLGSETFGELSFINGNFTLG